MCIKICELDSARLLTVPELAEQKELNKKKVKLDCMFLSCHVRISE